MLSDKQLSYNKIIEVELPFEIILNLHFLNVFTSIFLTETVTVSCSQLCIIKSLRLDFTNMLMATKNNNKYYVEQIIIIYIIL